MWNVVTSGLWARKRRLIGTSLAVVLGVAFLAATLVVGATMRAGFKTAFTDANRGIDVVVRNPTKIGVADAAIRGSLPASVVDQVAAVPGVRAAVPSVEGTATIVGKDRSRIGGDGPPTTGINWIADATLNPYRLAEGRAPHAPGEVVIDRGAAKKGGLHVGDTTTVLTPKPVTVKVVGIATFGKLDSLGPTTYTAFTLPQASELFAQRPDTISSVLVAADAGVSRETLRDEIMQKVPAHIEALTQEQLTAEQQQDIGDGFLDMFETILLAFAGIALVVATFSIHNTFSILVAQRTRESALLRALGASRAPGRRRRRPRSVGHRRRRLGDRLRRRARTRRRPQGPDGWRRPCTAHRRPCHQHRHDRDCRPRRRAHHARRQRHPGDQGVPRRPAGGAARRRGGPLRQLQAAGRGRPADRRRRRRGRRHRQLVVGRRCFPGRARRAGDARRVRRPRAGRGPPRRRSARRRSGDHPWRHGTPRPAQRDARPPAHRGERGGADGRHRSGGTVHHVRLVREGVDQRHGRQELRRRPRRHADRLQRCGDRPGDRAGDRRPARGRRRRRGGAGHGDGQRVERRAAGHRPGGDGQGPRPRRCGRLDGRRRSGRGRRQHPLRRAPPPGARRHAADDVRRRHHDQPADRRPLRAPGRDEQHHHGPRRLDAPRRRRHRRRRRRVRHVGSGRQRIGRQGRGHRRDQGSRRARSADPGRVRPTRSAIRSTRCSS